MHRAPTGQENGITLPCRDQIYYDSFGLSWKKLISVAPFGLVASCRARVFTLTGVAAQRRHLTMGTTGRAAARLPGGAARSKPAHVGPFRAMIRRLPRARERLGGAWCTPAATLALLRQCPRYECGTMGAVCEWPLGGISRVEALRTDNCEPLLSPVVTSATRPIVSSRAIATHSSSCSCI